MDDISTSSRRFQSGFDDSNLLLYFLSLLKEKKNPRSFPDLYCCLIKLFPRDKDRKVYPVQGIFFQLWKVS